MWRSRLPVLVNRIEELNRTRLTQQQISEATGLRRPTISAWMNWATFKRLDADVVGALADYLKCDPADLYEWVDEDAPNPEFVAVAAH